MKIQTTVDGKTMAEIKDLRLWPKNPRKAGTKDLEKLKKQILELGVYKPLIVTEDGEVLGGNQRFKIIQELSKTDDNFKMVWVSVVKAWTDEERLMYAFSDNFSAGTYSRDKLKELINAEQGNLFADFDFNFEKGETMEKFLDDFEKTEKQMERENVEKILKNLKIEEDVIDDIIDMTELKNVHSCNFEDAKLMGSGVQEFQDRKIFVLRLAFGDENEELYQMLLANYEGANAILQEENVDLYNKITEVYSQGKGHMLIKTLHLLKNLPTKKNFKAWQENILREEAEKLAKGEIQTAKIQEDFKDKEELL